jgi:uncharacterized protein YbbC (DUF1343 family)
MLLSKPVLYFFIPFVFISNIFCSSPNKYKQSLDTTASSIQNPIEKFNPTIQPGAHRLNKYLGLLKNKKIGLVVNPTSCIYKTHLVDTLKNLGIHIEIIFAPEHGFRGDADAGEHISTYTDTKTQLKVQSLYGKNNKPSAEQLKNIDILVFDIQDVGTRFYTFLSTMVLCMEACAENKLPFLILDRPNPNGDYIAGPLLDLKYKSFVGLLPIPIVHGCTLGEMAKMIQGEKWLKDSMQCILHIIPCENYTHDSIYNLPIKPSPNLPTLRSIRLYPSLCLFEGTNISVGRGTPMPFEQIGAPFLKNKFEYSFTPISIVGAAKDPMHKNKVCYGINLQNASIDNTTFTLQYLYDMYHATDSVSLFFIENNFFEKLVGKAYVREEIKKGTSYIDIEKRIQAELYPYIQTRKNYLLYPDFTK